MPVAQQRKDVLAESVNMLREPSMVRSGPVDPLVFPGPDRGGDMAAQDLPASAAVTYEVIDRRVAAVDCWRCSIAQSADTS